LVENVIVEKNKLGLTLQDYRCPICGTLHAWYFMKNKVLKRCRRCFHVFSKVGEVKVNG